MIKFLAIMVIGFLLSGTIYAEQLKHLPKETTVNQLIKDGYKLIDTNSVAYSTPDGYERSGNLYHLLKKDELVTCVLSQRKVSCWKP